MSTKTTFKRVALVAAVAAAFGGLSTVAANATASTTIATTSGSGITGSGTNAVTTNAVTSTYVSATITFTSDANNATQITSAGVGTINVPSIAPAGTSLAHTNQVSTTGISSTGFTAFASQVASDVPGTASNTLGNLGSSTVGTVSFSAYSATAGTQTISVASSTGTSTLTITWGAAPVFSSANSYAYVIDSTTATAALTIASTNPSADATTAQTKGTGTPSQVAVIKVRLLDNESVAVGLASKTVSASISGAGLLEGSTNASAFLTTPAAVASSTTDSNGYAAFAVLNSGVAGTGTIAITYTDANGVVNSLGSHSVVFYNTTPSTLKLSVQNLSVGTAGAALGAATTANNTGADVAHTAAVELAAQDANGNIVGGLTGFTAVSSNTNVLSNSITVAEDTSSSAADALGAGYYIVQPTFAAGAVSGSSATLTVTWTSTDGLTKVTAAPITFTVGGTTISSVDLETDAASYSPGNKVTLTLTAKDSSGNPVADGNYGIWGNTSTVGAITPVTASAQLTSNPFAAGSSTAAPSYEVIGGVVKATFFAPYTDGTVNLTSTLGSNNSGLATALQATTLAASFSVTTGASAASSAATDAANEATDAANAATDAANAAADAADAATSAAQDASAKADAALAAVNALSAKITVLAAQIAKIVKKLGA